MCEINVVTASRQGREKRIETGEESHEPNDSAGAPGRVERVAGHAVHPPSSRRDTSEFAAAADRLIAPLIVFLSVYVATLAALVWFRFPLVYWSGLIAVTIASVASIRLCERGEWSIGLSGGPRVALSELSIGSLLGFALVGVCALLVVATTDVRHAVGGGMPWLELLAVFLPAAVHEELLFRGYPFQKIYRRHRGVAIGLFAGIFSALHAGNPGVTTLALTNIFLGGVLLGLAYGVRERLWLPIGLHVAWNLTTGPILGHEVSGYESMRTLFVETGDGPSWLTGGDFGVEGSVWMTAVELIGIALLGKRMARMPRPL